MPFTIAHVAAVVPLWRGVPRTLPFSALVVGSMAPDFDYLLPTGFASAISHTLPGMFLFDLPAGLAVLWLIHRHLKQPIANLLPSPHRERLLPLARRPFAFGALPRLLLIIGALLVGISTHLIWDSFTHITGWPVQTFPFLAATLVAIGDYEVGLYKLLQHGSSVFGLLLLAWWYRRWLSDQPPVAAQADDPPPPLAVWLLPCSIGLATGAYTVLSAGPPPEGPTLPPFVNAFVVGCLRGLCLGVVILAWLAPRLTTERPSSEAASPSELAG
jgi:hypothetical protein